LRLIVVAIVMLVAGGQTTIKGYYEVETKRTPMRDTENILIFYPAMHIQFENAISKLFEKFY
jgi:hypothetical protein